MNFSDIAQLRAQEEVEVGPEARHGPTESQEIPTEEGVAEEDLLEGADFSLENARAGQSLVDQGIGIMVAVIVVGAVAIPVSVEVLNNLSVGGTTGQILGYVPLALGVGLFVAAISIVR